MEFSVIEVNLYEIGFSPATELFALLFNERVECLWRCLKATKTWFDTFLTIKPAQYVGISLFNYAGLMRCFIAICMLSSFDHPDWDHRLVGGTLDVILLLEETERNFRQVKEAAGFDIGCTENIDPFNLIASKFGTYKMMWKSMKHPTVHSSGASLGDELGNDFPMPFMDDDWLNQTFGPVY